MRFLAAVLTALTLAGPSNAQQSCTDLNPHKPSQSPPGPGLAVATVGAAYMQIVTANPAVTTWASSAMPNAAGTDLIVTPLVSPVPGLDFRNVTASSVTLAGTPTQAGTWPVPIAGIVVTTTPGGTTKCFTQTDYVVTVNAAASPLKIETLSLPNATVNVPYRQTIVGVGGTGRFVWSVVPDSGTTGVTIESVSGSVTIDTSTARTLGFTVHLADAVGGTATQHYTVVVSPSTGTALSITTLSLPEGAVNTPYTQTIGATGGTGNYTWSVNGSAGVAIAANTGVLTIDTTTARTVMFTATVSDGRTSASQQYTVVIKPASGGPLTIVTQVLPGGFVGEMYMANILVSGGSPPYQYGVTGPPGLMPVPTIDTAGKLRLVPNAVGLLSIKVSVIDNNGLGTEVDKPYTINITPAVTLSPTAFTATVGVPFMGTVMVANTSGPCTLALNGPSLFDQNHPPLPPWIRLAPLSPTTGELTGTPDAAGTVSFDIGAACDGLPVITGRVSIAVSSGSMTTPPASYLVLRFSSPQVLNTLRSAKRSARSVSALVSFGGDTSLPIGNPTQIVGYVENGMVRNPTKVVGGADPALTGELTPRGPSTTPFGPVGQGSIASSTANPTSLFYYFPFGTNSINGKANCPDLPMPGGTCTDSSVTLPDNSKGKVSISILSPLTITMTLTINSSAYTSTMDMILPGASVNSMEAAQTADPISTASGELLAGPNVDLSLGGPFPLMLRRSYGTGLAVNSASTAAGYNWMTNFDLFLVVSGKYVTVALEGGGSKSFQLSGSSYQPVFPAALKYQLVKDATGYRYLDPATNLIETFNPSGRLIRIEDRNGNALTITPNTMGSPSQVSDGLGRTLTFTYSTAGLLTKVQDQSGRSVSYAHGANSSLTAVTDANGNSTSYSYVNGELARMVRPRGNTPYTQTFDPNTGAAVTQTDSFGNVTKLAYVSGGKPGTTVMTDPLGRTTTFQYPNLLDLGSVTDPLGQTTSTSYDSLRRPVTLTDRLGNKVSITYDAASGYPASITDARGNTTAFTYQSQTQGAFTFFNLSQIVYADGTSESFRYDGSGNVLTATDRAGKSNRYTYNSRGQVQTDTNAVGGVTTYTYNADGTLASVKLPSGDVTSYTYDAIKRLSKIQNADNTTVSFTRDALDQILSIADERGKVTKFSYDANNKVQSTTDALNHTLKFSYDTGDLPSAATDALGNVIKLQYDPLGSVTAVTNPSGETSSFSYDKLDRLQVVADPAGKGPRYAYDAEGHLASVTDALGNQTAIAVNQNGLPTQVTSPLGETAGITYDSMDRMTGMTDALGRQGSVSYEARGLTASITSPGAIRTGFTWGDLPLLSTVTDPNGSAWRMDRDTLGRVTAATDPLGNVRSYTFDARGRVSSITSPADSVRLTYDAAGNLAQAQYTDGVNLNYTYDDDNRVTGGTGFSLVYDAAGWLTGSNGLALGRDATGRMSSLTYAPGKYVNYTYDNRGLLSTVVDWAGGSVNFTFDDAHRLVAVQRSNGAGTAYTYDANGRMATISDTDGGGNTVVSIVVTRDAIGRVTSAIRTVPQEAAPAQATAVALSYDAASQIAGASYDGRGRLTDDKAGSSYKWSASSRLLSYARPDGTASFTYDGRGQRISRTGADGSTVNYVLNYATRLPTVATVRAGDADVQYYVYTPGGSLLYSIDARSGVHRYYSFDDTGSTTILTDDAGTITDSYGVSPYGDTVTAGSNNQTDNPFVWQGQAGVMQEKGTSLYYARFRYYDAAGARFLSRDPVFSVAPKEINPYQYAAGNPVANGDPTGLKTNLDWFAWLPTSGGRRTVISGSCFGPNQGFGPNNGFPEEEIRPIPRYNPLIGDYYVRFEGLPSSAPRKPIDLFDKSGDGHRLSFEEPGVLGPSPDTGFYDDGHSFGWRCKPALTPPPDDTGFYDDGHSFGWARKAPPPPPVVPRIPM